MSEFNPKNTIETERLIIRFVKEQDREDLFKNIFSDEEVLKYFVAEYSKKAEDVKLEQMIESSLKGKRYFMSVVLKETEEVIGLLLWCSRPYYVYNSVEIGYAYGKQYWNKGYASEALKAFIEFTFREDNVHKIYCMHLDGNMASKRVMEKCGMHYECKHKDEIFYQGKYFDTYQYYLINPRYKEAE